MLAGLSPSPATPPPNHSRLPHRHSRESGNPRPAEMHGGWLGAAAGVLDSGLRRNDGGAMDGRLAVGCVGGESPQPPFCGRGAFGRHSRLVRDSCSVCDALPPVIPATSPNHSRCPGHRHSRESGNPPPGQPTTDTLPQRRRCPHRHSRESGNPHPGQSTADTPPQRRCRPHRHSGESGNPHPGQPTTDTPPQRRRRPHRHSGAGRNPEPR